MRADTVRSYEIGANRAGEIEVMDLRGYYRKIRELEATIAEDFPIVRSLASEDGGRSGKLTEVPRAVAARMVIDGSAEIASAEEARDFRQQVEEARKAEQQRRQASQIQFTILSEAELQGLQRSVRGSGKNKE
jgi:hypothetical protein